MGFDMLNVWIWLRLHDLLSDQSCLLIIFITLYCFFFDLLPQRASIGCLVRCLRELVEPVLLSAIGDDPIIASASTVSDLSIIEPWRLLDQYTPKVIDFYLRTNLNFLVVFFVLMPLPNSIDSISSALSRALEFWMNTISSDTNSWNWIDMLWY